MKPETNVEKINTKSEDTGSDSLVLWFIEKTINSFNSLVSEDQYLERLKVCKGCEFAGDVKVSVPGPEIFTPGCTVCGCPFSTKPRAKRYFSFKELKIVDAICPHKDGNLWENVDKKY